LGWFIAGNVGFGATTNDWINNLGGLWRDGVNWSSNVPPDVSFNFTLLTNAGTKTVTIDAATPANNLSIQRLTLSAPAGATNTLRLVDLTTNVPLQLSSTLTVGPRALLSLTNSAITIGSGGILDVTGGAVISENSEIDCSQTAASKLGDANGAVGSLTLSGGRLRVFQIQIGALSGAQGVLQISNGLLNSSSLISLGDKLNSSGTITLAGGQLLVTNDITKVGNLGTGQLNIAGGVARFAFLSLGDGFGSSGIMNVTGGQFTVVPRTENDLLRVGNFGNGELNISAGTNRVMSEFHIADDLGATGLVAVTGGLLIATNQITAIGRYGYGAMTISNGTVQLTNCSVGRHDGGVGTLTIRTNGVLDEIDDLSIGRFFNSIGHVLIDGGSLLLPNENIWVGREGTGDLVVSNGTVKARAIFVGMASDPTNMPFGTLTIAGGTTLVSSNFIVGRGLLSTGSVLVTGGRLVVTNNSSPSSLVLDSGNFDLAGGTVVADNLVLTNTGQWNFSSGTLRVKNLSASNGAPFVVGDGSNLATLDLLGGTFVFAGGLVISSNATVTGCGTILGNVTNQGTLATNCGPSVAFTSITRAGSSVVLSFKTLSGSNHVLEYKNSLSDLGWTQILPGTIGNGGVMTQTNVNAPGSSRFYRIHIQ
jgi:T5SS/PEP-CTERM-associated repeat protein